MAALQEIVEYLDSRLRTSEIRDYPGASNGLQVETRRAIQSIAAAVDASAVTARMAASAEAELLLVHHGLFWGGVQPLRGPAYERVATFIKEDIGLYSSHLPLDLHPDIGNNVLLARALGLEPTDGFARFEGQAIGVSGESNCLTTELVARADRIATEHGGRAVITPIPHDRVTRRWGLCTGAGASSSTIAEAAELGIDTMIVGEGPHHTAVDAMDRGIAIIYAGHYATETLGITALAADVAERFGLSWTFLAAPTGL